MNILQMKKMQSTLQILNKLQSVEQAGRSTLENCLTVILLSLAIVSLLKFRQVFGLLWLPFFLSKYSSSLCVFCKCPPSTHYIRFSLPKNENTVDFKVKLVQVFMRLLQPDTTCALSKMKRDRMCVY